MVAPQARRGQQQQAGTSLSPDDDVCLYVVQEHSHDISPTTIQSTFSASGTHKKNNSEQSTTIYSLYVVCTYPSRYNIGSTSYLSSFLCLSLYNNAQDVCFCLRVFPPPHLSLSIFPLSLSSLSSFVSVLFRLLYYDHHARPDWCLMYHNNILLPAACTRYDGNTSDMLVRGTNTAADVHATCIKTKTGHESPDLFARDSSFVAR